MPQEITEIPQQAVPVEAEDSESTETSQPTQEDVDEKQSQIEDQKLSQQQVLGNDIAEIRSNEEFSDEEKKLKIHTKKVDFWYKRAESWVRPEGEESDESDEPLKTADVFQKLKSLEDPSQEDVGVLLAVLGKKNTEVTSDEDIEALLEEGKKEVARLQSEIVSASDVLAIQFIEEIRSGESIEQAIDNSIMKGLFDDETLAQLADVNGEITEEMKAVLRENVDFWNVVSVMIDKEAPKIEQINAELDEEDSQLSEKRELMDPEQYEEETAEEGYRERQMKRIWKIWESISPDAEKMTNVLDMGRLIDMFFNTGRGSYGFSRSGSGVEGGSSKEQEDSSLDLFKGLFKDTESTNSFFTSLTEGSDGNWKDTLSKWIEDSKIDGIQSSTEKKRLLNERIVKAFQKVDSSKFRSLLPEDIVITENVQKYILETAEKSFKERKDQK